MHTPTSGSGALRTFDGPIRTAARLLLLLLAGLAVATGLRSCTDRTWRDPEPHLAVVSTRASRAVLDELSGQGVRLDRDQRRAVEALVGVWQRRPEMRRTMALRNGTPDFRSLLSWAAGTTDPTASVLADLRGDLLEVQLRMGIPDGTGNIIPVFRWALRNRERPVILADNAILRMATVWNERPELVDQFLIEGRVDVRGFIWWCANVRKDDPHYWTLDAVNGDLQRLSAELPPLPLGRGW